MTLGSNKKLAQKEEIGSFLSFNMILKLLFLVFYLTALRESDFSMFYILPLTYIALCYSDSHSCCLFS